MENYENNNTNPNFSTNQEKINLNFDILNDFPNQEVFEAKLGNLAFLKKKRFSENLTEKDEKIKITLEKGGTEDKEIPAINFIRWRYKKANKTVIDDNNENLPENSILEQLKVVVKTNMKQGTQTQSLTFKNIIKLKKSESN